MFAGIFLTAVGAATSGVADDIAIRGKSFHLAKEVLHSDPQHEYAKQDTRTHNTFKDG